MAVPKFEAVDRDAMANATHMAMVFGKKAKDF